MKVLSYSIVIFTCLTGLIQPVWAQPTLSDIEEMIEREQYDLAEAALKQVIEREPGNAKAYYGLGTIYHERAEYYVAECYFRKGIKSRRREPLNHAGLGRVMFASKDLEKGRRVLETALEIGRKDIGVNLAVIRAFREGGTPSNRKEAETLLIQLDEKAPRNAYIHLAWGNIFADSHQPNLAINHYQKAIEFDPQSVPAYVKLADCQVNQKDFISAQINLTTAMGIDSLFPHLYLVASHLYLEISKHDSARAMAKKYYDLTGHDRIARPVFGETLFLIKDYRGVIDLLESQEPHLNIENRLLAMAYLFLGKKRLSKQHLDMCFTKEQYRERIVKTDTLELYKELADMAKADKQYELEALLRDQYIIQKLVVGRVGSLRDHYYAGIANFRAGKPEKADSSFIQVLNIKPDFTAAHFWRLRIAKSQDPENKQWLVIPHALQVIKYLGGKPIKELKSAEKSHLRTCYQLMTVYHYAEQADGSGNCEAARPWLEKALIFAPKDEYLLGIRANCPP